MNNGRLCSANSIPIKLLKILESPISVHLSRLIIEAFVTGVFPGKLKVAKVILVFKKGLNAKMSNYRPISLLCIFSKIFEKIIYHHLYNFFNKYGLLYSMQFGFHKGHSAAHTLVGLTESIESLLDTNRVGCGIYIDLQKAIDSVHYDILLKS